MVAKRDIILRGSCFCEKYISHYTIYIVLCTHYTINVVKRCCLRTRIREFIQNKESDLTPYAGFEAVVVSSANDYNYCFKRNIG